MIPKECKRLAEVDFPIAVVSKHSAREKSIRHGHPSTLHLWWARRPLAACRAMLLALLWPDPCDSNCPEDFKEKAREVLAPLPGKVGTTDEDLRKALLKFIGDFADWDRSNDPVYLETSKALVKAAHGDEPPLVVDPFAGGGSIPLEALRVGCDVFASDLNPVACLILKVMLEDIPRWGRQKVKVKRKNGEEVEANGLAEALKIVGKEIKDAAEKELKEFYPDDEDGAKPISYLWARTVLCEAPNCGAEIPLMRSFWLCKKPNRKRALKYNAVRQDGQTPKVEFEIFEPKSDREIPNGTVTRAKATCLCCGTVLQPERVRAQLSEQNGGADTVFDEAGNRVGGARLLAVVTIKPGEQGRQYRLPNQRDYEAVWSGQKEVEKLVADKLSNGLNVIPDEPLPPVGTLGFRVQRYGVLKWGDLFSARQKLALSMISSKIGEQREHAKSISLALGKFADLSNAICPWEPIAECPRNVLSNGRIKPSWDFAEGVSISDSSGSFAVCVENLASGVQSLRGIERNASWDIALAQASPLPTDSAKVWFTDPPYYDAIPYADLSDMFFVWYKRTFPTDPQLCDPFDRSNPLTPKKPEAVCDETKEVNGKPKDKLFFENVMGVAFAEGRRVLLDDGVASVVFAHKTTEGWEALLSGIIQGGWTITGSWPIATEMASRLRARDSAALATSVHLVCRPRTEDANVGDWAEVLQELPVRVKDWMERLQQERVRGADLVFACIGPALEIFSRHSRVETADGREVTLAEYLEKVWEVVGRSALEQVLGTSGLPAGASAQGGAQTQAGAAGVLEEDARLTALFLWTLQNTNGDPSPQPSPDGRGSEENGASEDDEEEDEENQGKTKTKGFSLIFDVARRFAQPLGIHLPEWEGRIIETKKGVVRLLSVSERTRQLFGTDGAQAVADQIEQSRGGRVQGMLFPDMEERRVPKVRGRKQQISISDEQIQARREATTLDRVHAAMLLQAGGRANALRALINEEMDRGGEFLRLANALSALYPRTSEEKRLLDAMLLAVPR